MNDRLRVAIPKDWPPEQAVGALLALAERVGGKPLAKALQFPLPNDKRAGARRGFDKLQREFQADARDFFSEPMEAHHTPWAMRRWYSTCRIAYQRAFEYGLRAGGADRTEDAQGNVLQANERAIVERQVQNEGAYAANFLTDVEHGEGSMSYQKRADMYAAALQELFWQGYLYADQSPDRYVQWIMRHGVGFTDTENCRDCARLSGNLAGLGEKDTEVVQAAGRIGGRWGTGVYQAQELARMGIAPQSGALACTTHCHCKLVPVKRPTAKPNGKPEKRFVSLAPKEFTGTGRNEQGKRVVTRAAEQGRRIRLAVKAVRTEHRHVGRAK